MRIMFVLNAGEGGATLSACDLMGGLTRRGHTCFATLPPGATEEGKQNVARVTAEVAPVFLSWWNKKHRSLLWKRPLYLARDFVKSGAHARTIAELAMLARRWNVDVIHTNTAVTIEPAFAAKLTGRPHVWHIREMIQGPHFRFWLPDAILARTFSTLSDALIANSSATAQFFNDNAREISVVHNGVDVAPFAAREGCGAQLRAKWTGDDPNAILVGMVASLGSTWKRHELFIRAAAIVAELEPRARFAIVGVDPDATGGYASEVEYSRGLKALAAELGVASKLVFTGHVPDVPAIMDALHILAHPCETESFGRIAIEAMAAARPVVGVNGGGIAEIVDDGATGYLVPPGDAGALADAILALCRDPVLRTRMGDKGRSRARATFSIDSTVSAVESVYDRVTRTASAFERSTAS